MDEITAEMFGDACLRRIETLHHAENSVFGDGENARAVRLYLTLTAVRRELERAIGKFGATSEAKAV